MRPAQRSAQIISLALVGITFGSLTVATAAQPRPKQSKEFVTTIPFDGSDIPFWILKRSVKQTQRLDRDNPRTRGGACICKKMSLRGAKQPDEAKALGPKGDGSSAWPVPAHRDKQVGGGTLGPLDSDPQNAKKADGEKTGTGVAFEIETEIEGAAAECKEIQLIKATHVVPGVKKEDCENGGGVWADDTCTIPHTWHGDFRWNPREGTEKQVSIAGKKKCEAAGGKWVKVKTTEFCRFQFPQEGTKYGPDESGEIRQRAYRKENDFKKYLTEPKTKIIWFDAPGKASKKGLQTKADFIAIVRGTDGKYCFVQWHMEYESKDGVDKEELTVTGGSKDTPVDASGLPAGL